MKPHEAMSLAVVLAILAGAAADRRQISKNASLRQSGGQLHAEPEPKENSTAQRVRLDVGFNDFKKRVVAQVDAGIRSIPLSRKWTEELRQACTANVSGAVGQAFDRQLTPLKQSIGKTWVALPKDEQKNAYVQSLKTAFVPVMDGYAKTIGNHLNTSIHRMIEYTLPKPHSELSLNELLGKCAVEVGESLTGEHCYEDSLIKTPKGSHSQDSKAATHNTRAKGKAAMIQSVEDEQFCIPSVLSGLARRLNDTQGLISMSMRFDAGAMALAQRLARKPNVQ